METEIEKIERGLNIVIGWEMCEKKRNKLAALVKKPVLTSSDLACLLQMKVRSTHSFRKRYNVPYMFIHGRYYYLWTSLLKVLQALEVVD